MTDDETKRLLLHIANRLASIHQVLECILIVLAVTFVATCETCKHVK